MTKNLVIVESPAKAKTIERYLGDDFKVLASYGHVRDLPENPGKGKLGVDVEHDFAPEYVISEDRRKQVSAITKAAAGSDLVYLATDLDREGEAIAWHVVEAVDIPQDKRRRVTFSEITKGAIRDAFAQPRGIDMDLVDAQQTRRIVDRMVGYTLSPLITRKVRSGLSAGRVQSVAVRLVVEREREIEAFTAREYWTLDALLQTPAGERYRADLVKVDGTRVATGGEIKKNEVPIADEATAQAYVEALRGQRATVNSARSAAPGATPRRRSSPAPCSRRPAASSATGPSGRCRSLSGSTRASTIDGEPIGLITYMRTDSVNLADVRPARGPGGHRAALRQRIRAPREAAATRPGSRERRRLTRPSGPPASRAIPIHCRAASRRTSCACTGSSGSARWPRRWPRSRWRRPPWS